MEFILDCETKESTFESLAAIFNCNHSDLKSLLSEVNLEQIYELQWRERLIPYTEYVYNYVVKELGEPNSLDGVCWFHCTRTMMSNKFEEGILPLGESINRVWSMMLDIVKNSHLHQQLVTMKKNGVNDFQYTLKTEESIHWGPYGILNQKNSAPRGGVWKSFARKPLVSIASLYFFAPRGGELYPY